MTVPMTSFLRNTLFADAATGASAAVLTITASGFLSSLLGLPAALIFWAGVALLPIVAFLLVMARRNDVPRSWLREIVLINWIWVAFSFAILLSGLVQPNLLGVLFVVAQALAVALFATLQGLVLRAAGGATARVA